MMLLILSRCLIYVPALKVAVFNVCKLQRHNLLHTDSHPNVLCNLLIVITKVWSQQFLLCRELGWVGI
jgi:hypothetical protein